MLTFGPSYKNRCQIIATYHCSRVNVRRRVNEAVPQNLILVHVVRALHQLGTDLAVVLEVGILAGEFVLVP